MLASLVPLKATVAAAGNATVSVVSGYPFEDVANVSVTTGAVPTVLKLRVPAWASKCTVNGQSVPNGTYHVVSVAADTTVRLFVELRPEIVIEKGM